MKPSDALGEETSKRLSAVKAKYDPDAVFSRNPTAPLQPSQSDRILWGKQGLVSGVP